MSKWNFEKSLMKALSSLLFLVLIFSLSSCTSSKKIDKIALDIPFNPQWAVTPSALPEQILTQKFYYLKGGHQCYSYVSADNTYVLKFFKKKPITPKLWLNYLPFDLLKNYKKRKIEDRLMRREQNFLAYKIAYEELRTETALIHLHLYKTAALYPSITLVERNGEETTIPLDRASFVLQEKALLLSEKMAHSTTQEEADQLHSALLQIVERRCKKQLRDLDLDLGHNYGFIGDRAVHIDVGKVIPDPSLNTQEAIDKELERITSLFHLLRKETVS